MWWTSEGKRVLQGAEAALFREALGAIVDMVREDDEGLWQFDAPPFDELRPAQKLALLAQVGSGLLREDAPAPDLTAVTEATVGAIYEVIRLMVEWEIEQPAEWRISPSWREMVLAASREKQFEGLLDPESADLDGWEVLIGALSDGILWDEDWRESQALLDADPKASQAVKEVLGTDEDYYVAVPPDPTDEEMAGIWAMLRELTLGP